jgi:hypothetical protein
VAPSTSPRSELPPPSEQRLAAAKARLSAIETADGADRPRLAADAIFELERDRLPVPLLKGIGAGGKEGLDVFQKARIFAAAVTEPESEWTKTCLDAGALPTISKSSVGPTEASTILFERCKLARFDLVKADEAPRLIAMSLAIGFASIGYLERRGALVEPEPALFGALMREPIPARRGAPPPRAP